MSYVKSGRIVKMKIQQVVKIPVLILGGFLILGGATSVAWAEDPASNVLEATNEAQGEAKDVSQTVEGFSPLAAAGEDGDTQAQGFTDAMLSSDRISLDLRSIEVSEALRFIATRAKLNMVISKLVAGRLFLVLNNVPIKDVLDIIILSSGLAYDKQGEIYQIMTEGEYKTKYGRSFSDARKVKIFHLQYAVPDNVFSAIEVFKSEIGRILVDKESGMVLVMETPENMAEIEKVINTLDRKRVIKSFFLQYAKAREVEERLKTQLNEKGTGNVQADDRTNQLIVQAYPDRMIQIEELIKSLDKKTKEVLIVSKIIRITLSDNFESEIKWEALFKDINLIPGFQQGWMGSHESNSLARAGKSFVDDFINITPTTRPDQGAKVYPTSNFIVGQSGEDGAYEVLFKFLKTIGNARVLSSPRITVVNNQEAKIHVGERQAYITSTSTTGSSGQNTVAESVTFVDVGIELSVTPTINDDGFITMKIKPSISSVKSTLVTASGNKIPIIDTSEAETTVMVRDKTGIMIAGLRKDEWTEGSQEVPYFSKVPVFGALFKSGAKKKERTEVIVLLTPYITGGEKMMTGEVGRPVDTMNSFRGYSSLTLDTKIRTGDSSASVAKL
ncbi:MAG: secretin N-terminal domain-containing protein [Candidatus Omnitrophota bacterium]